MSQELHGTEGTVICPWCSTEIVWDEEIGPEKHCPHCENELSGYRTLTLGEEDEQDVVVETEDPAWEDGQDGDDTDWAGASRPRSWLMADEKIQRIMDDQEEMPECPSCREYMLLSGIQQLHGFQPAVPPSLDKPLLPQAPELQVYICPSCHEVSTKLGRHSREWLSAALGAEK